MKDAILNAHSYNKIETDNLRIPMINTGIIDPPKPTNATKLLIIVQTKKGKPSDNLIRGTNDFIKTKRPIYVLQFNDDFVKYFNDFKPRRIDYFEPDEVIEPNGETSYKPDQNFLESYFKTVNDDCLKFYLEKKRLRQ